MHSFKTLFLLLLTFKICAELSAQIDISDPGCIVAGQTYIYNVVGNYNSSTTMTWCVSSNGTIVQVFGNNVSGSGSCRSGNIGSIYVKWNSGTSGFVTLTSSAGNANPLNFQISPSLNAGFANPSSFDIPYYHFPPNLQCPPSSGGHCSPSYVYQWQESGNASSWADIPGAVAEHLSLSYRLTETTHYRRRVKEVNNGVIGFSNVITVNVEAPFSFSIIAPSSQDTYPDVPPAVLSGPHASGACGQNTQYQWQRSIDSKTFEDIDGANAVNYSPAVISSTMFFRRMDVCNGLFAFSNVVVINVYEHLNPGLIESQVSTVGYNSSPGTISGESATGDVCSSGLEHYSYQWQISIDGQVFTDIPEVRSRSFLCPPLITKSYFRRLASCAEERYSNTIEINVNPELFPGSIMPSSLQVREGSSPGILHAQPASGGNCTVYLYQWQTGSDGESFSNITGATSEEYSPGNMISTAYFRRKVTCGIDQLFTNTAKISVADGLSLHNFIIEREVEVPALRTPFELNVATPDQQNQKITYFDGLGRPIQQVNWQESPQRMDIVSHFAYDEFGREPIKYLPYASLSNNGRFKIGSMVQQFQYYNNGTSDQVIDDLKPFAVTVYANSPEDKILKQGGPGSDWQPDAENRYTSQDRTVKFAHESNGAGEVILWTYSNGVLTGGTFPTRSYYEPNQLLKTRTKDEEQNEVIEFKDKEGRTILKKVMQSHTEAADTYYIFDDFGNLVVVIPPEAVKALTN